jgi:hypothetical protein
MKRTLVVGITLVMQGCSDDPEWAASTVSQALSGSGSPVKPVPDAGVDRSRSADAASTTSAGTIEAPKDQIVKKDKAGAGASPLSQRRWKPYICPGGYHSTGMYEDSHDRLTQLPLHGSTSSLLANNISFPWKQIYNQTVGKIYF